VTLLIGYVAEQSTFDKDAVHEAINELEGKFDESSEQEDIDTPAEGPEDLPAVESQPPAPEATPAEAAEETAACIQQLKQYEVKVEKRPPIVEDSSDSNNGDGSSELSQTVIGGTRRGSSAAPMRTQGSLHAAAESAPSPIPLPSARRAQYVPLRSFLRRHGQRDFRTAGIGVIQLGGTERPRGTLKQFICKYIMGKNGAGPAALSKLRSEAEPEPDAAPSAQTFQPQIEAAPDNGVSLAQQMTDPSEQAHAATAQPGTTSIFVLYKNGTVSKGTALELSLEAEGFEFSSLDCASSENLQYVSYEEVTAVRVLNSPDESRKKWPTPFEGEGHRAVIALRNGIVLEGTVGAIAEFAEPRFLLYSTRKKRPVWTLIEKAGTIGILCGDYRSGMYNEPFEYLAYQGLADCRDYLAPSPEESGADERFCANDFLTALRKYQVAARMRPSSRRLLMKISLANLNLGIQLVREHKYGRALHILRKVAADDHLRTRAQSLAATIAILCKPPLLMKKKEF
jgi:hypothetical protein